MIVGTARPGRASLLHNFLYSPNFPALQTDLDAVWVILGLGENIPDDAFCQFAGALILLQDDQHLHARLYI